MHTTHQPQRWALSALLMVPLLTLITPCTGLTAPHTTASSSGSAIGSGQAPSASSRQALETFLRELDRAEDLYRALMFEEADRVCGPV